LGKGPPFAVYGKLCAQERGFSLHGATCVEASDRKKLEQLCRYMARPPLANERLHMSSDRSHVILTLKQPLRDGTHTLRLTPMELLEKLVALVPPPRAHLVRYFGILGPHDAHRALVVPKPTNTRTTTSDDDVNPASKQRRLSWAKLLARVFRIDVETCEECGGPTKIIAAITQRSVVEKILTHVGLSAEIPTPAPARAPPQASLEFEALPDV
jgi:hypothetical protein